MKKTSEKAIKFQSLVEIMRDAMFTGEYKHPDDPRRMDPRFKQEIDDIVDEIFEDEISHIRMVAEYEREILKREMEIIRLETEREIEQIFERTMKKLEEDIKAIYARAAEEPVEEEAEKSVEENLSGLKNELHKTGRNAETGAADNDRERAHRMDRHLGKKPGGIKSP